MKKFSEFMTEKEVASTEEVKIEEVKIEEVKIEEVKIEEVKVEETKTEVKVEEVKETKLDEAELSALQKEYQTYFEGKLKAAGVSSPAELGAEEMKKFFDGISTGWIKGQGAK